MILWEHYSMKETIYFSFITIVTKIEIEYFKYLYLFISNVYLYNLFCYICLNKNAFIKFKL